MALPDFLIAACQRIRRNASEGDAARGMNLDVHTMPSVRAIYASARAGGGMKNMKRLAMTMVMARK